MVRCSSLFSQLLGTINRFAFTRLVQQFEAEKGTKGFSSWEQLVAMLFCQLAQARSLREISNGLRCCEGKLRHLGIEEAPPRSTLSYANRHRPWQLFEAVFHQLLDTCRRVAPAKKFRFKNKLLSLDANGCGASTAVPAVKYKRRPDKKLTTEYGLYQMPSTYGLRRRPT
jgi:hypothetical protein